MKECTKKNDRVSTENAETVTISDLIELAGIGNLIGAGLGHLPQDVIKKIIFANLVKIHNTARAASKIRRMAREELLSRDRPFNVWYGLYLYEAKHGTLLHKMAAIRMLEKSADDFESRIAYDAICRVAPELRESAAEKVLTLINDPKNLREIFAVEKKYPILARMARTKLYKMFTL